MKIVKEILAGMLIALGGTIYLALDNNIIGALMFSFGLLVVLNFNFILYTGQIGYFFEKDKKEKINFLLILLFNALGAVIIALLLLFTNNPVIENKAILLMISKIEKNYFEIFVRAIMCGFMMIIAVVGYKKCDSSIMKVVIVSLSIAIFILCGFEHSIANIFYAAYATFSGYSFSFECVLKILVTVVGNSVGSIALYHLMKLSFLEPKETENN